MKQSKFEYGTAEEWIQHLCDFEKIEATELHNYKKELPLFMKLEFLGLPKIEKTKVINFLKKEQ